MQFNGHHEMYKETLKLIFIPLMFQCYSSYFVYLYGQKKTIEELQILLNSQQILVGFCF